MRAPQGLAAISQQPTGGLPASSSGGQAMAKYFELAKKMSDGQLADIMAGKSMDVPQFVAMTEAMGRRQLRQAVEGAEAQQQAQQPPVKDQLLAEYQAGRQAHMMQPLTVAGVDKIPAPNMSNIGEGHAAGGIVAFANTGVVGDSKVKDAWESLQDYDPGAMTSGEGWGSDISNFFKRMGDSDRKIDPDTGKPMSFKEFLEKQERKALATRAPSAEETKAFMGSPTPNPNAPPPNPNAPPGDKPPSAVNVAQPTTFERRASLFGALDPAKVDSQGIKDRGLGEG